MTKKLYVIKGTGLNLDGQVVTIVEQVGDYSLVSPPNTNDDIRNTMVKTVCLQKVNNNQSYFYRFRITKWQTDNLHNVVEELEMDIPNSIRDVPVQTIIDYLETNLRPILRME